MAYIGRGTDKLSNIEKLDTITFDGSSSYTLQKNSVNFTPNSANSLQISIDGVVQAGNFTVSGSTIDFGVAIPSTSTNDFIFHYGTGLVTTVADGAITTAKLGDASVTSAKLDAGKVLQVVSNTKTDTFTTTSTSFTDITGMSVSITPSSASNKILVFSYLTFGGSQDRTKAFNLVRGSTNILVGDSSGSRTPASVGGGNDQYLEILNTTNLHYLDSPNSTSATTYKIQVKCQGSTDTFYLNRTNNSADAAYSILSTSAITVMEISA